MVTSYVIITSREEVFKRFEGDKEYLQEFERKLNIKTPSYNYDKRKEILLKWATIRNCKWLSTEDLKNFVLDQLKNQNVLPTPLNIEQFAQATTNILDKSKLSDKLDNRCIA